MPWDHFESLTQIGLFTAACTLSFLVGYAMGLASQHHRNVQGYRRQHK